MRSIGPLRRDTAHLRRQPRNAAKEADQDGPAMLHSPAILAGEKSVALSRFVQRQFRRQLRLSPHVEQRQREIDVLAGYRTARIMKLSRRLPQL
jgi:hypothetical protein